MFCRKKNRECVDSRFSSYFIASLMWIDIWKFQSTLTDISKVWLFSLSIFYILKCVLSIYFIWSEFDIKCWNTINNFHIRCLQLFCATLCSQNCWIMSFLNILMICNNGGLCLTCQRANNSVVLQTLSTCSQYSSCSPSLLLPVLKQRNQHPHQPNPNQHPHQQYPNQHPNQHPDQHRSLNLELPKTAEKA